MFIKKDLIAVIVLILAVGMFVPVAQAQRLDVEFTVCQAITYNVVHNTPEAGIVTYDSKAIIQGTKESKVFDNWTAQGVGVVKRIGDKISTYGLAKRMAPDGEFIIWELHEESGSEAIWKPIYGTGKWKGIKGEVKGKKFTTGKPIIPGTDQFCANYIGWIEVPK